MQDDNKPVSGDDQPGQVVEPNNQPENTKNITNEQPITGYQSVENALAEPVQNSPANQVNPQTFSSESATTTQPTYQSQALPVEPSHKKRSLKLPVLITLLLSIVLAGSAGAYFGYVVPNKPENVWSATLVNMGIAYDEISEYSLEMQESKGVNITGDFKYTIDSTNLTGDFSVKSYNAESLVAVNISEDDFSAKIDVMTITPEGKTVPNIYARIDELNNFSKYVGEQTARLYEEYVDRWFVLDSSELTEQFVEEQNETVYTPEDYTELADAVGEALKEYVFTDDESRAVFVMDEVVGSETNYDQSTYHYKAKINQENLKEFEKKLGDNIKATKVGYDLLGDASINEYLGDIGSVEKIFDVWINKQSKLIQTIRYYDDEQQDYVELGQLYDGKDIIPLFVNMVEKTEKGDNVFDINLDLNPESKSAKLTSSFTEVNSGTNFDFSSDITTNNEQLELAIPNEATSFWTLIFGEYYQDISELQESTLGLSTGQTITAPVEITNQTKNIQTFIDGLLEWLQLAE